MRKVSVLGGSILIVGSLAAMAILAEQFLFATFWLSIWGIGVGVALTGVLCTGMWLIWGPRD